MAFCSRCFLLLVIKKISFGCFVFQWFESSDEKKMKFFFVMSKKVSTFAPAFDRESVPFAQVVELVDTLL